MSAINKLPPASPLAEGGAAESSVPQPEDGEEAYHRSVLPAFFMIRRRSLVRGTVLVGASLAVSLLLGGFPESRANPLQVLPFLVAVAGTLDTARNMRRRWSWYHGGVVLLLYTDLMVLSMVAFLWLYPYGTWLSGTH